MSGRLSGKVAIVTGAARGIGAGIADLLAAEDAGVIVADVLDQAGEEVAARIRDRGQRSIYQRLDVTSEDDWQKAVLAATDIFGSLTTVVNNAAIFNKGGLQDTSLDDWNKLIAVNLTGAFLGMRSAMPALLASGNGSIVNVCSLYGLVATTGFTSYHASKGGMRMLTRASALEYAKRGVRVNAIFPGDTKTPAMDNLSEDENAAVLAQVPMGFEGEPIDMAYGVVYLASDEARYLTGAEIVIDGGWSLP